MILLRCSLSCPVSVSESSDLWSGGPCCSVGCGSVLSPTSTGQISVLYHVAQLSVLHRIFPQNGERGPYGRPEHHVWPERRVSSFSRKNSYWSKPGLTFLVPLNKLPAKPEATRWEGQSIHQGPSGLQSLYQTLYQTGLELRPVVDVGEGHCKYSLEARIGGVGST